MPLVKYALIDEEGNPLGSVETGDYTTDLSGQIDSTGLTYQKIDFDKNISTADCQWYYDSDPDRGWSWRPERPSEFHEWKNKLWVVNLELLWLRIRTQRDTKLLKSDWTQIPDAPITEAKRIEWQIYRQALRDVPNNNSTVEFMADVVWPTPPA
jgi:hypothetical protein